MAITVDEVTKVISIPQADLLFISGSLYQLDTDAFRLALRVWESSVPGDWRSITHKHNPPVTVGGVTLARVVEIINGYTITFEDGQYRVILVGSNNNILDVANLNQVSIAPTNSAGLTFSKEIQDQSFTDSRIWIDTFVGLAGTQFPRGTPGDPVSGYEDAEDIAIARGLPERYQLHGSIAFTTAENFTAHDFKGAGAVQTHIDFGSGGMNTFHAVFSAIHLTGLASGELTAKDHCLIEDLSGFEGELISCGLKGTITLGGTGDHDIVSCHSDIDTTNPIIDANGLVGVRASIQDYSGALELQNVSGAGSIISVDVLSGKILIDSTCTAGTITVRGVGTLVDNSGPGCTVISTGLIIGDQLKELHQFRGLDPDNDLLIQDGSQTVDGKTVVVSDDGTTTTVNRTP